RQGGRRQVKEQLARDCLGESRAGLVSSVQGLDTGRHLMKAIVVTDEAAGTAGMTLVERGEPPAAINDIIVQIHASGFVPTEMAWPSVWTERGGHVRTASIPGR